MKLLCSSMLVLALTAGAAHAQDSAPATGQGQESAPAEAQAPSAEQPAQPAADQASGGAGETDLLDRLAIIVASAEDCGVDDVDQLLEANLEAIVGGDQLSGVIGFSDIVTPYVEKVGQMEDLVLEIHCQQVNGFVTELRGEQ